MLFTEGHILEPLVILGVIALTVLAYFIIQTLIALQRSLQRLDIVLIETEVKLKKLNSFINSIENVSDIVEKESEILKRDYTCKQLAPVDKDSIDSGEVATWFISSIKLGLKILKRR